MTHRLCTPNDSFHPIKFHILFIGIPIMGSVCSVAMFGQPHLTGFAAAVAYMGILIWLKRRDSLVVGPVVEALCFTTSSLCTSFMTSSHSLPAGGARLDGL